MYSVVQYKVVVENEGFAYLALNTRFDTLCDIGQMTDCLKLSFICKGIISPTLSGLCKIKYVKKGLVE